jgi:hypothetical protein
MPAFEELLAAILLFGGGGLVVILGVKFFTVLWNKLKPKDPAAEVIAEARKRVRLSEAELEADRLNKEAEKNYNKLYDEALNELDTEFPANSNKRVK